MPVRDHAAHDAHRAALHIQQELAGEIRRARLDAGLSQTAVGHAASMSHAQIGRIERGALQNLTIDQACRAAAAVGLRLAARLFPNGDPARDGPQLGVLSRFHARLAPGLPWRTEVPLPIAGDRRAWDGMIETGGRRAGCEAETRLRDIQALERRLALKLRDGGVDLLILVVSDTLSNRTILRAHREALRTLLPLDTRQVLASLRIGELPPANGLVVL